VAEGVFNSYGKGCGPSNICLPGSLQDQVLVGLQGCLSCPCRGLSFWLWGAWRPGIRALSTDDIEFAGALGALCLSFLVAASLWY
jgi:hypothetical protein